jgi:hypothetical protein
MREWIEVPQERPQRPARPRAPKRVRMALCNRGRHAAVTMLTVSITPEVHAALGWEQGVRLGLALGQGRTAGWVRLARDATGRPARPLGPLRGSAGGRTIVAYLVPPVAWRGLVAPGTICEHRIQGDALLVRIPWDMDEMTTSSEGRERLADREHAA